MKKSFLAIAALVVIALGAAACEPGLSPNVTASPAPTASPGNSSTGNGGSGSNAN